MPKKKLPEYKILSRLNAMLLEIELLKDALSEMDEEICDLMVAVNAAFGYGEDLEAFFYWNQSQKAHMEESDG